MKKKIYVHVADDHKIIIEGIIAVINTDDDIEIKGYSLTGKEVVDWFDNRRNSADVLILDITMPILDGFEVLEHFRRKYIKQKVIVLSSYDDLKIIQGMIDLGCNGYISKNNAGEHIVNAIKAVARGEQYYSTDIQQILLDSLSKDKNEEDPDLALTERDIEIIKLIVKECSTIQIADKLNLGRSTVESYRKKLLRKLNVKNSVGIAMYAVKNNIV